MTPEFGRLSPHGRARRHRRRGLKSVEQVTGRLTYGPDEVAGEAIQLLGLSPGAPASGGPIPQPA
jgi:hypothetical protein